MTGVARPPSTSRDTCRAGHGAITHQYQAAHPAIRVVTTCGW